MTAEELRAWALERARLILHKAREQLFPLVEAHEALAPHLEQAFQAGWKACAERRLEERIVKDDEIEGLAREMLLAHRLASVEEAFHVARRFFEVARKKEGEES